jgi:hypothetical protein
MPQTGRLQPWGFDTPGDMPDGIGPAVVCNDLAMILALAAAGHGIAYVPRFAVGRHIADGMLIELLEGHVAGEEAFQALWPSGRLVSPNIREFIDFAASHLRSVVGKATVPRTAPRGFARFVGVGSDYAMREADGTCEGREHRDPQKSASLRSAQIASHLSQRDAAIHASRSRGAASVAQATTPSGRTNIARMPKCSSASATR